jgi:hypothetical protein
MKDVRGEPPDLRTHLANLSNICTCMQVQLRGLYTLTPKRRYEGVDRLAGLHDRDDTDAVPSTMETRRGGSNDRLEPPDGSRSRQVENGEASGRTRTVTHHTYR